jgi:hypothetical protein
VRCNMGPSCRNKTSGFKHGVGRKDIRCELGMQFDETPECMGDYTEDLL